MIPRGCKRTAETRPTSLAMTPACRDADSGAGRDAMREPMRVREEPPSKSG